MTCGIENSVLLDSAEWVGALAKSKAGHDKDNLFIIIEESSEYVVLVDGNLRTLEKPKRKNKKHLQIIRDKEEPQRKKLIEAKALTDETIRRFIRCYKRESQLQGESPSLCSAES